MANDPTPQIQQCDVCLNIKATCRCCDCQQHLCELCKSTHDMFWGCKGHIVVTLNRISELELKEYSSEKPVSDVKEDNCEKSRSTPVNVTDFCPKHSEIKIELYCKKCLVAVCCKCFLKKHNGHTYMDLQEVNVREQIREELKTLKVEIEKHIDKLQNYSTSLQSKLSEVKEEAKTACETVDTSVRNICAKVHEMGENIKEEIQRTCKEENEKFTMLMTDIKTLTEDLQTAVKSTTSILEDNSVVRVSLRLPYVRREARQCRSRKLDIPDVMYPSFTGTEINERLLLEQLGEVDIHLETRFINTFNINQLKSTEGVYGSVKPCHGLPWCVYVSKESPEEPTKDETLGVYLSFINERVELPCSDILSCNVVVSLELINQLDESRSETADGTNTPTSLKEFHGGRQLGWGQFIIWDILANQENGFVDADNNFTVKVILKLIDVKRWKQRGKKHYKYAV